MAVNTPTDFQKFVTDNTLINKWYKYYDDLALRDEFTALLKDTGGSHAKLIDFLDDYGDATVAVVNKFKGNSKLIKHWGETPLSHISARNDINFLEGRYHIYEKDLNAYDHLANFKNRPITGRPMSIHNVTGGHTELIVLDGSSSHFIGSNGVEILDPNFNHIINPNLNTSQKMLDYLNGIGDKVYSSNINSLGHTEHKWILFKDPNPIPLTGNQWQNQWVLNGERYLPPKEIHTQYKTSWTEEYMKNDMAYAIANKELVPSTSAQPNPKIIPAGDLHHGQPREWIETTYKSTLIDGTRVKIKHVNHHRYNLQTPFDNHYSYFEIINN